MYTSKDAYHVCILLPVSSRPQLYEYILAEFLIHESSISKIALQIYNILSCVRLLFSMDYSKLHALAHF
jgi:hypothetical protein